MMFWDTSSVVPLCVEEPGTPTSEFTLKKDPSMVVWWGTRVEALSAISRRINDGSLDMDGGRQARRILDTLASAWTEILPTETVRIEAERAIGVHGLRTLDSFQLAAAMVWTRGRPRSSGFVCLDSRLRDAARREGFELVPAVV